MAILRRKNKPVTVSIHRLVAKTFIPNPKNKPFVNHIDGNKLNNKVTNLEWCTAKENIIHARDNGLLGYTKLTKKDATFIRNQHLSKGETQTKLANDFGVCPQTVNDIIRNKIWSGV